MSIRTTDIDGMIDRWEFDTAQVIGDLSRWVMHGRYMGKHGETKQTNWADGKKNQCWMKLQEQE
jgi:hypothetical protein